MSLRADQHTNALGQCCLELLVQLIDGYPVAEVENVVLVSLGDLGVTPALFVDIAPEDDANIKSDEDVVISGAGSHRKLVSNILLGDQELDFRPRETPDKTALVHNLVEGAELGDDRIRALWYVDVRSARAPLGNEHNWSVPLACVVAEPLETVVNVADADGH